MNFKQIIPLIFFICSAGTFAQIHISDQIGASTVGISPPGDFQSGDPEIGRIISIVNTVESKNSFIEQLNPDSTIALPFGIIKQIGAIRYVIAIDSMKVKPVGA